MLNIWKSIRRLRSSPTLFSTSSRLRIEVSSRAISFNSNNVFAWRVIRVYRRAFSIPTAIRDAIKQGRDYVFTDDHSTDEVDARLRAILAARADVVG